MHGEQAAAVGEPDIHSPGTETLPATDDQLANRWGPELLEPEVPPVDGGSGLSDDAPEEPPLSEDPYQLDDDLLMEMANQELF